MQPKQKLEPRQLRANRTFIANYRPMQNAIRTLRVQNFKSLKDVELKPRRVNLILGEPNVGKSNVLEAISLLGGMGYDKGRRFMDGMVRYEQVNQLFYDNLTINRVRVETDRSVCLLRSADQRQWFQSLHLTLEDYATVYDDLVLNRAEDVSLAPEEADDTLMNNFAPYVSGPGKGLPYLRVKFNREGLRPVDGQGQFAVAGRDALRRVHVRPYAFVKHNPFGQQSEYDSSYLEPPEGDNLKDIIQAYAPLRREITRLFAPYGLRLLMRVQERRLEVIKDLDGVVYSYPYSSTADTLQRLIFYLAAIESNDDAVLLFEEPEAHSFPTYVAQLGGRIVESRNNQFFVVTHSPYLVTEILEEMVPDDELRPELAVFVAYYEDYQTKIRQLSDDEVRTVRANGTEMFFNLAQFVPTARG